MDEHNFLSRNLFFFHRFGGGKKKEEGWGGGGEEITEANCPERCYRTREKRKLGRGEGREGRKERREELVTCEAFKPRGSFFLLFLIRHSPFTFDEEKKFYYASSSFPLLAR